MENLRSSVERLLKEGRSQQLRTIKYSLLHDWLGELEATELNRRAVATGLIAELESRHVITMEDAHNLNKMLSILLFEKGTHVSPGKTLDQITHTIVKDGSGPVAVAICRALSIVLTVMDHRQPVAPGPADPEKRDFYIAVLCTLIGAGIGGIEGASAGAIIGLAVVAVVNTVSDNAPPSGATGDSSSSGGTADGSFSSGTGDGSSSGGTGDGSSSGSAGDGAGGDDGGAYGCFVAGTLVATEGGLLAIDQVIPGMSVKTFDTETERQSANQVLKVFQSEEQDIVTLDIGGEQICCTSRHRFRKNGDWVAANQLKAGDQLFTFDGTQVLIRSVTRQNVPQNVFNLSVQHARNYFVSASGILVHNAKKQGE